MTVGSSFSMLALLPLAIHPEHCAALFAREGGLRFNPPACPLVRTQLPQHHSDCALRICHMPWLRSFRSHRAETLDCKIRSWVFRGTLCLCVVMRASYSYTSSLSLYYCVCCSTLSFFTFSYIVMMRREEGIMFRRRAEKPRVSARKPARGVSVRGGKNDHAHTHAHSHAEHAHSHMHTYTARTLCLYKVCYDTEHTRMLLHVHLTHWVSTRTHTPSTRAQ